MSEHEEKDAAACALDAMSRDELAGFARALAKNLMAIDGTWFQAVEADLGMDAAMRFDVAAWERFTEAEACRVKRFLGLGERPGLDGLARALAIKATSLANCVEILHERGSLVVRVVECRVQSARARKGMPYHPCKRAGIAEYAGFARAIDERISCECLSCYPEVSDETCACAWRFAIEEE